MPVNGFVFFFSSSVTSFLNGNLTENTLIMLSYLWGPLLFFQAMLFPVIYDKLV